MRGLTGPFVALCLLVSCALAHADSLFLQTQVLLSGTTGNVNGDQFQAFTFSNQFVARNGPILLQPVAFTEGISPIFVFDPLTRQPVSLTPYFAEYSTFAIQDLITLSDYNSSFQLIDSPQTYLSLIGSVVDNQDGSRTVSLSPQSPVYLGDNEWLIVEGFVDNYPAFQPSQPINVNAFLQYLPTSGSGAPGPAPEPTPEPSSLWLAGTGILAGLRAFSRRRT